ncbi:hypothetical protein KCU65_g8767, partial [Aureobasidium melanogenum]
MATTRDPGKDISFLLAVVHNLTVTSEFADDAIAKWPTDLCPAPVNGEDLGRGIHEIWQKWIGDDLDLASAVTLAAAEDNKKDHDGTCLNNAITIDDSDDEPEKETDKPITPITPRFLPGKFRIPPGASLVTPRKFDKVVVTPKIGRKFVVDLGKNGHEESTPRIDRACPATKNDAGLLTPLSVEKAGTIINKAKRPMNACSTKARKRPANNDIESESDDDVPLGPPTIGSTRKRRAIDYYKALTNDQVVDDSDEDYQYEETDVDRRLNEKFDSLYPLLATPSKRQKKTKS